MGLLRAIITLVLSFAVVNFLFKNKERLEQYPVFKQLLPYIDNKCYFVLGIMTIIMVLW